MINKLLIITREQDEFLKGVLDLGLSDIEVYAPKDDAGIRKHIVDADIIFGNPPIISSYINEAKNIKWMQSSFAGIDAMNKSDLKKDFILTNVKDVYGPIMSEYVIGYILMLEKNILGNIENQKQHQWKQQGYPSLRDRTIGIMGTGSIGSSIAESCKAFGMEVYGYSSSGKLKEYFDGMYNKDTMRDFLPKLDYLVSVLPNTQETQGVINEAVFAQMKESAVFINVGRGSNVKEEDLISALKNKMIAGAVLDVFQTEPLPKDSELWGLENIYITPHVSGYVENIDDIVRIFGENYGKYCKGEELSYQIDFKKGY